MTYRALLIDLDGVLRLWSGDDSTLEASEGLPPGALRSAAFSPPLVRKAITGQISDPEWRSEVVKQLQQSHPHANAQRAVDSWSADSGVIDQKVLGLIREARQRVKVVLVTNATSRLQADLEALGIRHDFDHIVNSSEIGAIKPEDAFYHHALQRVALRPADVLFVDDTWANVTAAGRLGFGAVHYQGPDDLRRLLEERGLR